MARLFLPRVFRHLKFVRVTVGCLLFLVCLKLGWPRYPVAQSNLKISIPPRILLVSALFPLKNAKHSDDEYRAWLANFLGPNGVECDVYFYTTTALEPLVRSLHASKERKHTLAINTTYATPFAVPPIAPYLNKYNQMHAWDPERDIHSPELYAVWNTKPWLLEQALRQLHKRPDDTVGVTYDYAFWSDAGSLRDAHTFGTWPDPGRIEEIFEAASKASGLRTEDMVFIPLFKAPESRDYRWTVDMGPVDNDFSEGSFFGSTPAGISWYTRTYYAQHNHYISTIPPALPLSHDGHHPHAPQPAYSSNPPPFHFVGKDQTLINALAFRHPERFFGVIAPKRGREMLPLPSSVGPLIAAVLRTPPLPFLHSKWGKLVRKVQETLGEQCLDEWYYYQWWLASAAGRRGTEKVRKWRRWRLAWFGGGKGCEETSVVWVEDVLEGVFGPKWVERRRARAGDVF